MINLHRSLFRVFDSVAQPPEAAVFLNGPQCRMGYVTQDMNGSNELFIITGGPGSGKSTLIEALVAEGLRAMPEAGRAIIQDQVAAGGDALPWADRGAFAERMFQWEMRSWLAACELSGPVIFDRGIPDVMGYLTLVGLPVPAHIE